MNQNFSSDQLLKLCKDYELTKNGLNKAHLAHQIDETFTKISDGTFEFNLVSSSDFYEAGSLIDTLILRKLNDNIKRLYKDEQSNRRVIIKQVSVLLEETCPFWVLRTDVSNFYGSIDRNRLLEKLQGDSLLSYFSILLIKKLFAHPLLAGLNGLPRGVALSATLSELYMRKFDRWAKTFDGVYYYARFVDDVIIFNNKQKSLDNLEQQIDNNLELGLKKNKKKTGKYLGSQITAKKPLDYLGYQFTAQLHKNKKTIIISIANKKVKKIKSRLIYSFVGFIEDGDFSLLEKRIKFLTGNYKIRSRFDGTDLRAGIYYNYCNISNSELRVFNDLNTFYQKTLHSKRYKFGIQLSALLTAPQKSQLAKYSFKHGFKNKVYHPFSSSELKQISNCWK